MPVDLTVRTDMILRGGLVSVTAQESLIADLLDPGTFDVRWANATSVAAVVSRLDPVGDRDQLVRAGEDLVDAPGRPP
jgi:hypothetical protein